MPKRIFLLILAKKLQQYFYTTKIWSVCLSTLTTLVLSSLCVEQTSSPVKAQVVPITPDGSTDTSVKSGGNSATYDINGTQLSNDGKNLFHSFSQFGLDVGQIANFISTPSILNIIGRVTGGNPSVINGLIQVTGGNSNLVLMNPAGMIFGANAQLNVPADFTATTATRIGFGNNNWLNAIGTNDYLALTGTPSTFAFGTSDTPGSIINAGELAVTEGKNLTLLGGMVMSTGQLQAPGGAVTIAAVPGENLIRISQTGHLLNLEIQPCGTSANCSSPATPNALLPNPLSLPELLTGSTGTVVPGLTVNDTGEVTTLSGLVLPQSPGTVILSGNADASSQVGGSVQLRGNFVGLVGEAQVNASGESGGGTVSIGGFVQGLDTASETFIGQDVTINANAGLTGNGGQVRILSDTTRFLGTISALGGTNGGNGGFVELAGTQNLTFNGTVDTSALTGERGTLLLNAATLALTDGGGNFTSDGTNNPLILLSDHKVGSNTLGWEKIAELVPKNNIVLQAKQELTITDTVGNTPNVTQNNFVNLGQNTGSLTLRSTNNSITFNDPNDTIQSFGSAITLEAANRITGGNFVTNGGVLTLQAPDGHITTGKINTSSLSGDGGRVILNAKKRITIDSIDTRSLTNGTGGNVEITTSGLFRASGTNSSNASISTSGGTQGGAITIRHGGGSLGNLFTVGSDYNGLNGTAGAISTGNDNEISSGAFAGSYSQGSPPSDIQIISPGNNTVTPQIQVTPSVVNTPKTSVSESSSLPPVPIDTGVVEADQGLTQQFEQYFDRTFNPASLNLTQVSDTLEQIDRVTGSKPALIYAVFMPATLESPETTQTRSPQPTDQLELILVTAKGKPIRIRNPEATRSRVLKIADEFRSNVTNARSANGYLSSARQLYKWLVEPLEADLQAQKINNLVFLMDSGLRSIPIAALHDGQGFLVERYSVGLMPSFNLTDTRYHNLKNVQVLAMGADTFPDQRPLPAVPVELSLITEQLWKGKAFLNSAFTLENLKAQHQQGAFGIIHLATHADFQPGTPENSYIQLANGKKLRLNQIPQLNWSQPPVELLVLSACRTAVGNEQAELGFAGLAVQAGVKSAVASLWIVSDEATLGLMSEFYRQLRQTPIKAEALRQAQLSMLKGDVRVEAGKLLSLHEAVLLPNVLATLGDRQLRHPYYWAAFTLIGNPW